MVTASELRRAVQTNAARLVPTQGPVYRIEPPLPAFYRSPDGCILDMVDFKAAQARNRDTERWFSFADLSFTPPAL